MRGVVLPHMRQGSFWLTLQSDGPPLKDQNPTDMKLYRSTITIWSEFDPRQLELSALAREAESGAAYCSKMQACEIEHPEEDPDRDGTDFFDRD